MVIILERLIATGAALVGITAGALCSMGTLAGQRDTHLKISPPFSATDEFLRRGNRIKVCLALMQK